MNAHVCGHTAASVCAGSGRWWGYHQWDGVVMEAGCVACDCATIAFSLWPVMHCTNPQGPHGVCRPSFTHRGVPVWKISRKYVFYLRSASRLCCHFIAQTVCADYLPPHLCPRAWSVPHAVFRSWRTPPKCSVHSFQSHGKRLFGVPTWLNLPNLKLDPSTKHFIFPLCLLLG